MSNNISILFFGQLAEVAGINSLSISDVKDTDAAVEKIIQQYPSLKNYTYIVALDKKVISENISLNDNQTLALMPPFSGG